MSRIYHPDHAGMLNIYVAERIADGWSAATSLFTHMGTQGDYVSWAIMEGGRYLFFGQVGDFYWVSTQLIEDLWHSPKKETP